MRQIDVQDWGTLDYQIAWTKQRELELEARDFGKHRLVLVEHPTVITVGPGHDPDSFRLTPEEYHRQGFALHETDRGGDLTLHSPGQLVIYPIFRISDWRNDLHWWLRQLEKCVILALAQFDLQGQLKEGLTGVWIEERYRVHGSQNSAKIAAIGIKVRKWVSTHGIAVNVNNELSLFDAIVPCGIRDHGVTSISEELGHTIDMKRAKDAIIDAFEAVFFVDENSRRG